ncbi:DNA mismatch repair endonuclease MutL [Limisalsivibrio acetivorans]|uniref:DNA mismatch repair endonuclease MutL n=1 Tax=Limisalsivibrio acetivorans TaxID=1304888 RepID=UPI0003B3AF49|nr:DNA mismatch repair endonuclease MutL [Limisalsivibrio acetivorans]
MKEIIHLPESVSNKVAAGEVVEKPLNAVKELVENALDADADHITIEIEDGGLGLIRVTDNGKGILPNDLESAVDRFATSKVSTIDDVYRIASFGFRGEALAAISSVSDFSIKSARKGHSGAELRVKFGEKQPLRPAPPIDGTAVTVRDLFSNVPARLKFFSGSTALEREITKFIKQFSIFHEGVSFILRTNGRENFTVMRGTPFIDRARESLSTRELAEAEGEYGGVRIRGAVSLPSVQRYRRDAVLFCVNGRLVKDQSMIHAVTRAYHRLIPENRFPAAAIDLHTLPEDVDANVHPAKSVVKLINARDIYSLIHDTVKKGAEVSLTETENPKQQDYDYTREATKTAEAREPVRESPRPFSGEKPPSDKYLSGGFDMRSVFETEEEVRNTPYAISDSRGERVSSSVSGYRIVGQLFDSVIVCENDKGEAVFIDQHVAHERVLYERFLNERKMNIPTVVLIEPIAFEADAEEIDTAEKNSDALSEFGFDIEPFGGALKISRVPADMLRMDIEKEIRQMLAEMNDDTPGHDADARVLTMSCKCAVKAGEKLTPAEMDKIVTELLQTSNPSTCPHGRPIMFNMEKDFFFRKFGR